MEVFIIIAIILGSFLLLLGLTCYFVGFRPIGIAANSFASCCQSFIGNVIKGSCFAILTSLGMRGCFILIIVLGVLILVGIGIYLLISSGWIQTAYNSTKNFFLSEVVGNIKEFIHWFDI